MSFFSTFFFEKSERFPTTKRVKKLIPLIYWFHYIIPVDTDRDILLIFLHTENENEYFENGYAYAPFTIVIVGGVIGAFVVFPSGGLVVALAENK